MSAQKIHALIHEALDLIPALGMSRASGQVEYKLLEASLWLQVIEPFTEPGSSDEPIPGLGNTDAPSNPVTDSTPTAPASDVIDNPTADVPIGAPVPVIEGVTDSPTDTGQDSPVGADGPLADPPVADVSTEASPPPVPSTAVPSPPVTTDAADPVDAQLTSTDTASTTPVPGPVVTVDDDPTDDVPPQEFVPKDGKPKSPLFTAFGTRPRT